VGPLNPVRIRLRHADLDTFVEKFAPNVTRGGVFLATRNHHPEGTTVAFEIQLANGQVALAGSGTVSWVREWNAAEPNRPHGMGVRFVSIDASTKTVLARLLRLKGGAGGSGPTGRRTTSPLPTLPDTTSGAHLRPPPVDTAVDLAAEYGVNPLLVRSLIERTWMTGVRADEDLNDLLRPEPVEPVSLSQALNELPRFLDQTSGRRRPTGGFRTLESVARSAAEQTAASSAIPASRDDEITDMTVAQDSGNATSPTVVPTPSFGEAMHEAASSKSHSHQ
jgi:uncharacterized protein (TIGR02266 family)